MDEPFSLRVDPPATTLRKGQKTRDAILNDALALASQFGLEGISIADVAQRAGLSKSGLFAHFGSKEELQRATLARAEALFRDRVLKPAQNFQHGLPRLRALFDYWLAWIEGGDELPGGCLMISAAIEYDDRPGPMREVLAHGHRELRGAIAKVVRVAVEHGELADGSDPSQFAFELFGIVLSASHEWRLLNERRSLERARRSFERLVRCYQQSQSEA